MRLSIIVLLIKITYVVSQTLSSDFNFKWRTQQKDASDNINDQELLRAVQDSVKEWQFNRKIHHRKKREVNKVCYNDVGCFDDSEPFSYLKMLPSSPEEINTRFIFYSTKNRSEQPLMTIPFVNMTSMFANKNKTSQNTTTPVTESSFSLEDLDGLGDLSIRVIVHGFGSTYPYWFDEITTALMAVEDCIVICVDWTGGSKLPDYIKAVANTRLVGKQIAMLLNKLKDHNGLDLAKTHLIGFSLGAHVSGFAGAELPGLGRISGLDPAGPLFEDQPSEARLNSSDARFVDVIHSSGGELLRGGLGSLQPMGDVDFYPNGGRYQNGCPDFYIYDFAELILNQDVDDEESRLTCNHRRAYKYFINSIVPSCQFLGFPCNSYDSFMNGNCFPSSNYKTDATSNRAIQSKMGYYADKSIGLGQFYLMTLPENPFCGNQFQIQIFNSFKTGLFWNTFGTIEATLKGEGGLYETFLISVKEYINGDVLSKIIIPQSAIDFPTSLSLEFKSSNCLFLKGLSQWHIDKIVLTDSFGRSHSFCKPQTLLSCIPVDYELVAGNCEVQ